MRYHRHWCSQENTHGRARYSTVRVKDWTKSANREWRTSVLEFSRGYVRPNETNLFIFHFRG
jgi:hypothetical protein